MFVFSVGIGLQWQSTNISISWNPSPQLIMFVGFSKSLYTVIQICSFFEMQLYLICYIWSFWVTCISRELNFQWFCSLLVNFPYIAYFFFIICVNIFLLILFLHKKFNGCNCWKSDRQVVWRFYCLLRIVTHAAGSINSFIARTLAGDSKCVFVTD